METRPSQLVRKHWTFVIGYCVATSLAMGVAVPGAFVLLGVFRGRIKFDSGGRVFHAPLVFIGMVSAVLFAIQLLSGPFVLSRNAVCRTCHRRQRLRRNPFFLGRYYRLPACDDCGGELEPALFWKPES